MPIYNAHYARKLSYYHVYVVILAHLTRKMYSQHTSTCNINSFQAKMQIRYHGENFIFRAENNSFCWSSHINF